MPDCGHAGRRLLRLVRENGAGRRAKETPMSSVVLRSIAGTASQDIRAGADSAHLDFDMRHLLGVWASMEPRPIEQCTVPEARAQPTLAAALNRIVGDRPDDGGVSMELRMIPGAAGDIKARIYAPADTAAGRPMVLYLHGGGFVVGDLGAYDAIPRALARKLKAAVVAPQVRKAPEFKLPAAHDDAVAAWRWMTGNAAALGGEASRSAIVGEDGGANLAVHIGLTTRGDGSPRPRHLGLVCPMAATDFGLPSHVENAESRPLSAAAVRWFYEKLTHSKAELADPRLNLIDRDLAGLPPVTLILAGLDPLRSEGELLADALRRSGIWVDATTYDGVPNGFIGLARIVNKAMFAQSQLIRNLGESLSRPA
jgi:acetyl esterase